VNQSDLAAVDDIQRLVIVALPIDVAPGLNGFTRHQGDEEAHVIVFQAAEEWHTPQELNEFIGLTWS
jgi:hypothetical protein